MISAGQAFVDAVSQSSRRFRMRLFYGSNEIDGIIRNAKIHLGSSGPDSFSVGAVYSAFAEIVLDGRNTSLEGKELRLDVGVMTDEGTDTYSDITLGHFTVLRPAATKYRTTFTAVGRITSKLAVTEFTAPATLTMANIASAIAQLTGVTITFASGIDTSGLIEYPITGNCRDALTALAIAVGGYATETNVGGILIGRYNSSTSTASYGPDTMQALPEIGDYDFEITGVQAVTPTGLYEEGDPINVSIESNYVTEDLFEGFAGDLIGFSYRPGSVALALGDPRIEPKDVLEISTPDEETYIMPCLAITHIFDGGFQTEITTPAVQTVGEVVGTIGAAVKEAAQKAEQASEAADEAQKVAVNYLSRDNTGIMVADMSGGTAYTPSTVPTGVKNTFIDNDSFDIRDGQTTLASFGATSSQIGQSSGSNKNVVVNADGMKVRSGTTELATFEELRAQIGKSSGGHLIIGSDTVLGNYLRMMAGQKILLDLNDEYMEAGNNNKGVRIDYGAGVDPMIGVSVNQSIPVSMSYNSSSGKGEIVSDYGQFGSLNVEGSVDMSGNLTIYRSGAPSVKVGNDVADIQLLCATNGNRGIYDPNLQKWLMRFDAEGIAYITSPINTSLVIDRSPSEDATSASIKITAGAGAGYAGASIGLYASTGATKGLYSYDTANGGGNEWIVWYNETDDAVYLNDKYCKRTVHSNTSTLYSETIKYSNGRLITNMRATISAACTTSGFGGYYNSSSIGVPAFPVAYANGTIPTVMTTVRHINGQAIYALLAQNVTSRTNPGGVYVLRSTSGTGDLEVDIHAEGVWK